MVWARLARSMPQDPTPRAARAARRAYGAQPRINHELAGTEFHPGRGYIWVDATSPGLAVKLAPNLVVDGAGRVLPAPGFEWVDVSDYTNDRVVPRQVLSIAMHWPSAFGTRAHVPASWLLRGCSL